MSFFDSLSEATVGEFIAWNFFSEAKEIKSVVDVRDDKRFRSWDVDFLLLDTNRQVTFVEVKTDGKADETGNFVYEVKSNADCDTIGCFEKTQAQMIAYYVINSNNLYLISVARLRIYVREHNLKLIRMGDNAKGYLLPIGDLERNGVIISMHDVSKYMKG